MGVISHTSDTITEKPILLRFGFLLFVLRPTTLAQIYEVGSLLENVDKLDLKEEKLNPVSKMLELYSNVDVCAEVATVLLFRSSWKRWLFGNYIKKRLTMKEYKRIIEYCATAFQATFFLTSFTFLKGVKETTKSTNTPEAIPSGDLSEE